MQWNPSGPEVRAERARLDLAAARRAEVSAAPQRRNLTATGARRQVRILGNGAAILICDVEIMDLR